MSDQTTPEKPVIDKTPPVAKPPGETLGERPREYGGPKGLEPTRYNDWERNGRCIDF